MKREGFGYCYRYTEYVLQRYADFNEKRIALLSILEQESKQKHTFTSEQLLKLIALGFRK